MKSDGYDVEDIDEVEFFAISLVIDPEPGMEFTISSPLFVSLRDEDYSEQNAEAPPYD